MRQILGSRVDIGGMKVREGSRPGTVMTVKRPEVLMLMGSSFLDFSSDNIALK